MWMNRNIRIGNARSCERSSVHRTSFPYIRMAPMQRHGKTADRVHYRSNPRFSFNEIVTGSGWMDHSDQKRPDERKGYKSIAFQKMAAALGFMEIRLNLSR